MAKTRKMVNLDIEETSGVDHPAHLHDGWLVMKAADPSDVARILDSSLSKEDSVEKNAQERLEAAEEALRKADEGDAEVVAEAAEEAAEEAVESTEAAEEAAEEAPAADETEEDVVKAMPEPVRVMFEAMKKQADEAVAKAAELEAVIKAERDARADEAAIAKAKGWTHLSLDAETVGKALRRLNDTDETLAKSIEAVLDSVNAQAESANIFAEIGKSASGNSDAYSQMTSLAKAAVDSGEATTFEQAFADVVAKNADLYTQYLSEKGA